MIDIYTMPAHQPGMMLRTVKPISVHYAEVRYDKATSDELVAEQQLLESRTRGELHNSIGGL